ncbi:hypothetical protein Micbo1qcDRAFT_200751 [Microdochium bolleyi]|uniref:Uncharacterized protein n=1 Tax=Microdochium bolleyi TaxID=196109 RepID=A0A136JDX6_9PEZI|nr:hypothetical protein Micbo1qcDRAFT_200751 [Microdochium bolleyi]
MEKLKYCSSLRERTRGTPAVAAFRAAKWKEADLATHDASMLLPAQHAQHVPEPTLRAAFVTAADLDTSKTSPDAVWMRLERLYHLNGSGRDSVVVFILAEHGKPDGHAMNAYTKLQADLVDKDLAMPIAPCAKWEHAPQTLAAFHRELCLSRRPARPQIDTSTVIELLRHSATRRPLSEHSVHVLTDLTVGLSDHLDKLSGQESRKKLLDYLGEEGERALAFWLEEYIVD